MQTPHALLGFSLPNLLELRFATKRNHRDMDARHHAGVLVLILRERMCHSP
jgi:hypothetical protein